MPDVYEDGRWLVRLFQLGEAYEKPLIAAVNGAALGGGVGLVALCHFAVAADTAILGATELRIGMFPMVIFPALARALGERRALELSLTARTFGADEALAIGLVQKVVPAAELDEAVGELARTVAGWSPIAVRIGMRGVRTTRGLPRWTRTSSSMHCGKYCSRQTICTKGRRRFSKNGRRTGQVVEREAGESMANMEKLRAVTQRVMAGGPEKYHEKLREQGKMFVRERLRLLLDDVDEFVEDGLLARNEDEELSADAVVTGIGRIHGQTVCIMASDSTVKAGSWGARTVEKIVRIQEKALQLNVPIIYLVDSAGGRITDQVEMFPGRRHAGRIFYNQVKMSGRVPQLCILFGPSPAGAAYLPALSDVVIMVDETPART